MADFTTTVNAGMIEFEAHTDRARELIGGKAKTVSAGDAVELKAVAEKAGMLVVPANY